MGNHIDMRSGNPSMGVSATTSSCSTFHRLPAANPDISAPGAARRRLLGLACCATLLLPLAEARAATINLAAPVGGQVDDLALYYNFNETSGSTVTDGSGLNVTGTINQGAAATAPFWSAGVNAAGTSGYGNGLSLPNPTFDTTTKQGYVASSSTGAASPLNLAGSNFTIGLWIKMDSINAGVTTAGWLLDKKSGSLSTNGWALLLNKTNTDVWSMNLRLDNASSVSVTFTSLNDLAWHHLAVSYNAVTNEAVFYVDGLAIGNINNTLAGVTNNGTGLTVGQRNTTAAGQGTPLNMQMDDLFVATSIYDFAAVPEPSAAALVLPGAGLAMAFFGWRKLASGR